VAEVVAIDFESADCFSNERRLSEPRDLQIICSSLLTVTKVLVESRGRMETVEELRLAHFSVKEYLRSPSIASSPVQESAIRDVQAHLFIAESCLAYISHVISNPPLADK